MFAAFCTCQVRNFSKEDMPNCELTVRNFASLAAAVNIALGPFCCSINALPPFCCNIDALHPFRYHKMNIQHIINILWSCRLFGLKTRGLIKCCMFKTVDMNGIEWYAVSMISGLEKRMFVMCFYSPGDIGRKS